MHRLSTTLLATTALLVSGCGADDNDTTSSEVTTVPAAETGTTNGTTSSEETDDPTTTGDTMTTISGSLSYRQRIALRPGGSATITLSDVSMQDTSAVVIAEEEFELGDQQVPIPFELDVDTAGLDDRGDYSVRATITGPSGELRWTTDTANLIDIESAENDLGELVLVQVDASSNGDADAGDAGEVVSPIIGSWTVTRIGGQDVLDGSAATLVFDSDGTLSGNASCNTFTTEYSVDEASLTIDSEIAVTAMACEPAIGAQESAFLAVLDGVTTYEIVGSAATLILTDAGGTTMTATR